MGRRKGLMQYGFFFDQSRCSGCHACAVACKNWHRLPPGPVKYLRVYQYEKGFFPAVRLHFQWIPCYHCEKPVCLESCPQEAIRKEEKYGAVLIDGEKCNGCRTCYEVCPYGAPVFETDRRGEKARKCDMCMDRLESGWQPICASACPLRTLDFGPLEELGKRYGDRRDLEDLPGSATTKPAVIFKPHAAKRQLVSYDAPRAFQLLRKRDPLPPLFHSSPDLVEIPKGMIGREELVIKHPSSEDLMRRTRNDEG
jgi:anaerobic dimethyl sulfoxide reductase subunit B (iron-sulfur subunit)